MAINAQWYGIAEIPVKGGTAYILLGDRWLSGPNNNPACPDLCGSYGAACAQPDYFVGTDAQYWQLLEFDDQGNIMPFKYAANFTLDLLDE